MRDVIENYIGVRMYTPSIVPAAFKSDEKDVCGMVIAVNGNINLFHRLGYDNNSIGKALMKNLAAQNYDEVILRDQPDRQNRRREYSLLIAQNSPYRKKIKVNKIIIGELEHEKHAKGTAAVLVNFSLHD